MGLAKDVIRMMNLDSHEKYRLISVVPKIGTAAKGPPWHK